MGGTEKDEISKRNLGNGNGNGSTERTVRVNSATGRTSVPGRSDRQIHPAWYRGAKENSGVNQREKIVSVWSKQARKRGN